MLEHLFYSKEAIHQRKTVNDIAYGKTVCVYMSIHEKTFVVASL